MRQFSNDPKQDAQIRGRLRSKERELVQKARRLCESLTTNKERQLRNVLAIAESAASWPVVELFVRYQAAREELPAAWARPAIKELEGLEQLARNIAPGADASVIEQLHMELVRRVLGYTVWWHVWDMKGQRP